MAAGPKRSSLSISREPNEVSVALDNLCDAGNDPNSSEARAF